MQRTESKYKETIILTKCYSIEGEDVKTNRESEFNAIQPKNDRNFHRGYNYDIKLNLPSLFKCNHFKVSYFILNFRLVLKRRRTQIFMNSLSNQNLFNINGLLGFILPHYYYFHLLLKGCKA